MTCPLFMVCPLFGMSAIGRFHCIYKKRVAILVDGHCLPRTVFHECKNKDISAQYFTYKALLSAAIASIQENWNDYCHVVTEDKDSVRENLLMYSESNVYMLPLITIDLVLYSLSNITSCNTLIYYFRNENLSHALFSAFNNHAIGAIEIVLLNGHYVLTYSRANECLSVLRNNSGNVFHVWLLKCCKKNFYVTSKHTLFNQNKFIFNKVCLYEINIYFYSIELNLYSIKYIYMISKYIFAQ